MRMIALLGMALLKMSGTPPKPLVQMPPVSECSPVNGAQECKNLLPVDFEKLKGDDLESLIQKVNTLRTTAYSTTDLRMSDESCRKTADPYDRPVLVTYSVPRAMENYPANGTGGRSLVAGIFEVNNDLGCFEKRYKIRKKNGDWAPVVQFLSITTDPSTAGVKHDTPIGSWTAWSVERHKDQQLRLRRVDGRRYIQCAGTHPVGTNAAFWDCESVRAAFNLVGRSAGVTSIASVLQQLADPTRKARMRKAIRQDAFTDPAWGQCGALGCCIAE